MRHFVIGTVITAIAFVVVSYLLPQIKLGGDLGQLLVSAAIFGVVNAFIKPVASLLSFPISAMTLGLFGFVVNAALFLLVAWISVEVFNAPMSVGGFPASGLTVDAFLWAFVGSIAISIVSTVVGLVVPD